MCDFSFRDRPVRGRWRNALAWLLLWPGATALAADPHAAHGGRTADAEEGRPVVTAFVSVDATAVSSEEDEPRLADEGRATADLLLTWQRGGFRALGELVVATDETELERLQLGWELAPNTLLWVGRFHQPASYFGYLYHHGQIAQTAISRPQVDDWEDEGGLVPQHLEGLLLDTSVTTRRGQRFDLSIGAGVSPALKDGALEPLDVFSGHGEALRPAYAARVTWYPDALRDPSVSLVLMHAEVSNGTGGARLPAFVSHVDENAVGLFVDYPAGRWRVTGGAYRIGVEARGGSLPRDAFWSGYLQAECEVRSRLRAFARYEGTSDAGQSRFLSVFDAVVESRVMAGLRWDVTQRQALSVEAARTRTATVSGSELRLQWSAVAR